jgi:hypothetical protein
MDTDRLAEIEARLARLEGNAAAEERKNIDVRIRELELFRDTRAKHKQCGVCFNIVPVILDWLADHTGNGGQPCPNSRGKFHG